MKSTNGGKTGWPPGMLQDDSRELSKWLSSRPDARRRLRESLGQVEPLTNEEIDQIAIKCLDASTLGWNRNLARAIERAHGIGGSDE